MLILCVPLTIIVCYSGVDTQRAYAPLSGKYVKSWEGNGTATAGAKDRIKKCAHCFKKSRMQLRIPRWKFPARLTVEISARYSAYVAGLMIDEMIIRLPLICRRVTHVITHPLTSRHQLLATHHPWKYSLDHVTSTVTDRMCSGHAGHTTGLTTSGRRSVSGLCLVNMHHHHHYHYHWRQILEACSMNRDRV